MIFQTGTTGRSLYMSVEQFLNMSDEELTLCTAFEQGSLFNHPFMDTALVDNCKEDPDEEEEEEQEADVDDGLFDFSDIEELLENDNAAD